MSGYNNYIVTKDYMKEENFDSDEHQNIGMAQTICLFKKYLLTRNHHQHGFGKTNVEESEAIKRRTSPRRRLIPPTFGSNLPRPVSLLEQGLLPGIGCDVKQSGSSSTDDKSSRAQLTIFYSGAISVYDNVSVEKAQAIMLLAGESSFCSASNLAVTKVPKTDVKKPIHGTSLPSVCKLQAELPVARKRSIQEFLKKRRDRIRNKSPYASSSTENEDNTEQKTADGCSDARNETFTPSPFPSRLGFFIPTFTNKGQSELGFNSGRLRVGMDGS